MELREQKHKINSLIKDGEKLRIGIRHMLHEILSRPTDDPRNDNIFVIGVQVVSELILVWVMHRIDGLYCTKQVYDFRFPTDENDYVGLKECLLGFARLRELLEKAINALKPNDDNIDVDI